MLLLRGYRVSLPVAANTINVLIHHQTKSMSRQPRHPTWVPATTHQRNPTQYCCREKIRWISTRRLELLPPLYLLIYAEKVMSKVPLFRHKYLHVVTTNIVTFTVRQDSTAKTKATTAAQLTFEHIYPLIQAILT